LHRGYLKAERMCVQNMFYMHTCINVNSPGVVKLLKQQRLSLVSDKSCEDLPGELIKIQSHLAIGKWLKFVVTNMLC